MGKSIYTPELAERVLAELRKHGSTLRAAAAVGIDRSTITSWCELFPEFEPQYARAKADGIDAMVEDTIEIADEPPPLTAFGSVDGGAVQHAKVRIETRRWYAERLAARKYGVLIKQEIGGPEGGPIVVDDTAKAARVAQLMALAAQRKEAQDDFGDLA